jgi:hypothetical protein
MIWAMTGLGSMGAAGACAHKQSTSPAVSQPAPVFARSVVLAPVSGKVLIASAGGPRRFVALGSRRVEPVGTVVDATAGRVSLTSANPPQPGGVQTGQFFRGIFRVEQRTSAGGLVDLVLRDNVDRSKCAPTSGGAGSAALSQRVLGLLRGSAKGRFRTTGRFAAATVRGTDWGLRDRCDGTLTVVRDGVVVVRDFRLNKNVVVRAGHTYLAEAP